MRVSNGAGVMQQQDFDPLKVFYVAGSLSSFAGLAELLRSGRPLTPRAIIAAILNSGLIGLSIGLLWYHYFLGQGNIYFLIGVCVLAGLGGSTAIDFMLAAFKKGGIHVNWKPPKADDKDGDA